MTTDGEENWVYMGLHRDWNFSHSLGIGGVWLL